MDTGVSGQKITKQYKYLHNNHHYGDIIMPLKLLKEAVLESKYSANKKETLKTIQEAVGKKAALRIIESYEVTPEDYDKWLTVINGYAVENGLNIRSKAGFEDVAYAVLENDPAPIDEGTKDAIVSTLWANQRAKMSHNKVQKALRAQEEEEQLNFAIKQLKGREDEQKSRRAPAEGACGGKRSRHMEDEQESVFSQAYKSAKGMEDEEDYGVPYTDDREWDEDAGVSFTRDKYGNKVFDDEPWYEEDRNEWFKHRRNQEDEEDTELSPDQVMQWARQFERGDISADEFRDLVNFMSDDETDEDSDDDMTWDRDRTQWDDEDRTNGEFNLDSDYEDEQYDDFDPNEEFDPRDFDEDYNDDNEGDLGDDELDFEDPRDADIMRRGREMEHSRDLEDFDPASDEGSDRIDHIMKRGRDMERAQRLMDTEPPMRSKSKPRAFYAAENEEVGKKDYSSPFHNGQTVQHKKDKNNYVVEIPDGPGDMVGVMDNGRIRMIPSKELIAVHTGHEDEESTSKPSSGGKVSFLHDVLTGTNSHENMKKLQQEIETDAANAWTTHHAKMPKNPHPKGSIAYKAWEKGIATAAKAVWAPKPVLDVKVKPKPKAKPKKR